MGEADGVYGPAGNSPLYVRGECKGPPRGLRPCRASHGDYVDRVLFIQDILMNWGLILYTPLEGLKIGSRQNRLRECLVKNEPL
jgi:hypothetical protein